MAAAKMQEEEIKPLTKEEEQTTPKETSNYDIVMFDLEILESSNQAKDNKLGSKLVKHIKTLRRKIKASELKRLWTLLLPSRTCPLDVEEDSSYSPTIKEAILKHPYTTLYVQSLTLSFLLLDSSNNQTCQSLSWELINNIKKLNKWILDHFWSYNYYLFSRAQEKNGALSKSIVTLFQLYRSSCVSKNTNSQAMLLNLILRSFLLKNDFKGASEFIKHTLFPENKMNNEFIKYLYYTSLVKAMELQYRESFTRVTQALRKSPEKSALGFRVQAQKLAIVVEMLMGDIPSRSLFVEGEVSKHLFAYYELTKSLVRGDVKQFEDIVAKHKNQFSQDGLLVLVNRLTQNVIRAGLKRINLSYSRISFADICQKLSLSETSDVESMVAKAIRDGVITAEIDFGSNQLIINENNDIYSTKEPQMNFQKRIDYCTNMISLCNKALMYQDIKKNEQKKEDQDDNANEDDLEKLIEAFEDEFM